MQLNVQVTKSDIDNAKKNNKNHCMVADAIKRTYPELVYVNVTQEEIRGSVARWNRGVENMVMQGISPAWMARHVYDGREKLRANLPETEFAPVDRVLWAPELTQLAREDAELREEGVEFRNGFDDPEMSRWLAAWLVTQETPA